MASQVILLEDGWNKLKSGGVNKIEAILEDMHGGVYKDKISTEEYSALYTTVYTMCTQKPPNNWSEHLYNNYCDAVKDYLSARILPRIKEKHDEAMLTELVRRWENHKLMCARASPAAAAAAALSRSLCTSLGTRSRTSTHFSHHAAALSLSLRIKFLSHVFKYIDRFYVKRLSLPELAEVGSQSFHDIVFNAVKRDVRSAILEV